MTPHENAMSIAPGPEPGEETALFAMIDGEAGSPEASATEPSIDPRESDHRPPPPRERRPPPAPRDQTPERAELAELAVVGAILLSGDAALGEAKAAGLEPRHYANPTARIVFQRCAELADQGAAVTLTFVTSSLDATGDLEDVGGPGGITAMVNEAEPVLNNIKHHAALIIEAWSRREIFYANRRYESRQIDAAGLAEAIEAARATGAETGEADVIDLRDIDAGARELPTLAPAQDGRFLFYKGRINEIHGEPAAGKTNILLCASLSTIRAGGRVLYIDPEDTAAGIKSRLVGLGATDADLASFHYACDPSPEAIGRLHKFAHVNEIDLVPVDGLAAMLAREGLDENAPGDVLGFFRARLRPFQAAGGGVVVADHVSKNAETRGRWGRGSGAKMGAYDGAVYEARLIEPYSPGKAGFVRLVISKDRNGGAGVQGEAVAELHFEPGDDGTTKTTWRAPEGGEAFRPTAIIAKIEAYLETHGSATVRELRGLGKAQWVDAALKIMQAEGTVTRTTQGQRHIFRLKKETVIEVSREPPKPRSAPGKHAPNRVPNLRNTVGEHIAGASPETGPTVFQVVETASH